MHVFKLLVNLLANSCLVIKLSVIAACTNYSGCLVPQNTITLPPGFQLPPGAVIVKNEAGQYMVVSGPQPQVQQPQIPHIQQQTSTSAILPQQYKFNTVRVCI